jgi:hypothetical protein
MSEIQTIEQSRELVADSMSAVVLGDKHIQARVNMIQGAIKNIFKKDTHYGVIPGTSKPTLYKPGAEQLLVMFRIAPSEPKTEDLSTGDSIRYRVTRSGVSQIDGRFLGAGVGECSSDEEKYKWRRPVCNEEFEESAPDRKREVWRKSYGKTEKIKQVRTNPSDLANTILKMADKRAMVAMTLSVTGASDAFSQDLEDLPPEYLEQSTPSVSQPARKSAESAVNTPPPTMAAPANATPTGGTPAGIKTISFPQGKRFFAIAKGAGKSDDEIKAYLASINVAKTIEMPVEKYDAACEWAAKKVETVDTATGEIETETPGVGE